MNNISYLTLSDAVSANKPMFISVLRDAFNFGVKNLSEEQLKNAFFPELQQSRVVYQTEKKIAA